MTSRFDLLRSWVRTAADASRERIGELGPVANAKRAFDEIRSRRATLSEAALGSAFAQAPGIVGATARISGGRILVDASYDDGETVSIACVPEKARFAPRGAKEVVFVIEPPDAVGERRVRELVGCLAAAIARALWGPMMPERQPGESALVERDGARLRVDLRSVPAVRAMLEGSPLAMALDVIGIEAFTLEERSLRLKLSLPFPTP